MRHCFIFGALFVSTLAASLLAHSQEAQKPLINANAGQPCVEGGINLITWAVGDLPVRPLQLEGSLDSEGECRVKVTYNNSPRGEAVVKNNRFSFLCNRDTQGTCVVMLDDKGRIDNITYSNPAGGRNRLLRISKAENDK